MNARHRFSRQAMLILLLLLAAMAWHGEAIAAQLQLTWTDNSIDEDGFKIERKVGTTGTYEEIAVTGPNVSSYIDSNLAEGTTYCYRVRAFNSAGDSDYSNEDCGTARQVFALAVVRAGTGNGTVISIPVGIACGSSCAASYAGGTAVSLHVNAAAGSTFTGWSGGGCAGTGSCTVTLSATTTVSATFDVFFPLAVTHEGTGSGTVTSTPAGISCGSSCVASFPGGAAVTLTAAPATGSTFTGWSGGGCAGLGACTVTVAAATTVTATFAVSPTFALTVTKAGTGSGTVTSTPGGITCGASCAASYASGTAVTLTATAATGSTFTGWSGACSGTGSCLVTIAANATVTATFTVPTITITSPTGNSTYSTSSSSLTLGGTASDNVTQVTWANDRGGSGTASGTTSWTATGIVLQPGTNVLSVTARDAAGNTATASLTVTFSDTTPPTVTITSPPHNSTYTTSNPSLTLGGTAFDNVGVVQVTWANDRGGSGAASGTTSWTATGIVLQPGSNVFTVTARDAAGNSATVTLTVTLMGTSTFTDDPLMAQSTLVKAVHIMELRATIDRVRATRGLATFTWTDPILSPGITAKVIHLIELRTVLEQAYRAADLTPPTYTDPVVVPGQTDIKAIHLYELRTAVWAVE